MRVALHTLGCKANQADATYLAAVLRQKGYQIVGLNEVAEYYIFNTCTVTDEADREARQLTRRAKRKNPNAKVIVTGCYAQTQAEAVAALPSVDMVVGNAEKENIPDLLPSVGAIHELPLHSNIRKQDHVPSVGLSHHSKNTRAQVKIQDGCNKFCTFCIIPFARGKNRSVPPQQIVAELHELRSHGFEEAVLTGIHIGTYGHDIDWSLEQLLELIEIERPLPRIRLSSLDPEEISDGLIKHIATSQVICPHVHIAVQSGDNEILARMKRRYQVELFENVVAKLTQALPDIAIGTDLIVGFPGETDEQFEKSCRLVENQPVSYAHVFPYSTRRGTAAANFSGHLDPSEKKTRTRELRRISEAKKQRYFEQFIGKSMEIIVENRREPKEGLLRGVTPNYIPVHFEGADELRGKRQLIRLRQLNNSRVYGLVA